LFDGLREANAVTTNCSEEDSDKGDTPLQGELRHRAAAHLGIRNQPTYILPCNAEKHRLAVQSEGTQGAAVTVLTRHSRLRLDGLFEITEKWEDDHVRA